MKTTTAIPVSERALIKRINRSLRRNFEKLKKCQEKSRCFNDLGSFYVVDQRNNLFVERHVDIEAFGRDIGVLKTNEMLTT